MNKLKGLEPEKVYKYFEEISAVPRGSGNTEAIAAYCLEFAEKRGLRAVKDSGGNVIIYADGTEGYENSAPFIIQGHMDMVCEKTADCVKDMEKEGLDLCTDGKYVWAEGTTLGGDDGIALAFMFAVLDSDDIPHPPIEAVITRDEETGMYGAEELEYSLLKGKKLLNIDSEEEGILTVSCAGGITARCEFELSNQYIELPYGYEISVSGLLGGHSGVDIGKGRLNAFRMLAEPLSQISGAFYFGGIGGGGKMNVIPQSASVIIGSESDCLADLEKIIENCNAKKLGGDTDPDIVFAVREINSGDEQKYIEQTAYFSYMVNFLKSFPTGVQSMSESIQGMVETSLNMGVLELKDNILSAEFLIRSNSDSGKNSVIDVVRSFADETAKEIKLNKFDLFAEYPSWEYREASPLRDLMADVFREMYGKEPVISGIHAGLECAIFSSKLADADMVSIGPDIHDIHTPDERMDIASVARTWDYVKEILKRSK